MHWLYACLNLQVFAAAPCPALPPGSTLPSCRPTTSSCRVFARYKMCMWLSTIVLFVWCGCGCRPSCCFIYCRFWKPPRAGEVLPKFRFDTTMFLLLQERLLQRPRLVTLQDNKVRHKRPFFPYHVRISRNLARRLPFERDTVGNMHIFLYLKPYLFRIVHVWK